MKGSYSVRVDFSLGAASYVSKGWYALERRHFQGQKLSKERWNDIYVVNWPVLFMNYNKAYNLLRRLRRHLKKGTSPCRHWPKVLLKTAEIGRVAVIE